MKVLHSLVVAAIAVGVSACGKSDFIIAGRSADPCLEALPACPPRGYAECEIDPSRYAKRRFPGVFNFMVDVDAGNEVDVLMLLAEQIDTGLSTQIVWNEPGCSDWTSYNSDGADLFYEARNTGVLTRTATMERDGEHLIEIESDMQALVLITIDIIPPGTR